VNFSFLKKIKKWASDNKFQIIVLTFILLIGAYFRLYRIGQYMTFLGDEGRDALVVRRFLVNRDLIFVGPGTSVGNMYLGPIYYYMMAPALLLANFSPVGPAVEVALLGVATVFLVWYVSKKWFGIKAAFFASALYAVSPVVIVFSKSSWNPDIMPFFSLLTIYFLWKVWWENDWKYLLWLGISFAFVLQSHYLGLILLPFIILIWGMSLLRIRKKRIQLKKAVLYSFLSSFFFFLLMSPLLLFDLKHHWRNWMAMKEFFSQGETVSIKVNNIFSTLWKVWELVITRLIAGKDILVGRIFTVFVSIGVLGKLSQFIKGKRLTKINKNYLFILLWLLFFLLGMGLYKGEIYDHYFGFIFPLPFILLGGFLGEIADNMKILGKSIAVLTTIFLILISLYNSPLKDPPSKQMQRTIEISRKISEEVGGKEFNLAVISDSNYEGAYQYFLELWGSPLLIIDPQKAGETIADQLFVVCEYEDKKECQPISNPKAEIANFGWSKIEDKWVVDGVILFKLIHYQHE